MNRKFKKKIEMLNNYVKKTFDFSYNPVTIN